MEAMYLVFTIAVFCCRGLLTPAPIRRPDGGKSARASPARHHDTHRTGCAMSWQCTSWALRGPVPDRHVTPCPDCPGRPLPARRA